MMRISGTILKETHGVPMTEDRKNAHHPYQADTAAEFESVVEAFLKLADGAESEPVVQQQQQPQREPQKK